MLGTEYGPLVNRNCPEEKWSLTVKAKQIMMGALKPWEKRAKHRAKRGEKSFPLASND